MSGLHCVVAYWESLMNIVHEPFVHLVFSSKKKKKRKMFLKNPKFLNKSLSLFCIFPGNLFHPFNGLNDYYLAALKLWINDIN